MPAGFGEAPLIKNEGFASDPTDDKTNGRFYDLFRQLFGVAYNAGTKALTLTGDLVLGLGKVQKYTAGTNGTAGVATLVAGTVEVATTAIKAGDKVRLTRQVTGGTEGHLTVGTVTAGTKFVIDSSSNSDTSQIFWEIVRPVA